MQCACCSAKPRGFRCRCADTSCGQVVGSGYTAHANREEPVDTNDMTPIRNMRELTALMEPTCAAVRAGLRLLLFSLLPLLLFSWG